MYARVCLHITIRSANSRMFLACGFAFDYDYDQIHGMHIFEVMKHYARVGVSMTKKSTACEACVARELRTNLTKLVSPYRILS